MVRILWHRTIAMIEDRERSIAEYPNQAIWTMIPRSMIFSCTKTERGYRAFFFLVEDGELEYRELVLDFLVGDGGLEYRILVGGESRK